MSDIDTLRDEKRTEDDKMELIADYLETVDAHPTIDSVLTNGSIANSKTAKFKASTNDTNFITVNESGVLGQKTTDAGVSTFKLGADGDFYVDFQPAGSNSLSTFQVSVKDGTARVVMSDDIKAAFKSELGIE